MKTYLIVGGSKGIGKAIVEKLIDKHYVINISRTFPNLEHKHLQHYSCDITQDALPELEHLDGLNGLIYCPGSINLKPFTRLSVDDFRSDLEINVLGAVKTIQKYLPLLKTRQAPSVLLFSTVATKLGMPFHTSVATAKSGVEGLVKALGAELVPTIRINAIAPTVTETDLASKLLRNETMKARIIERHPLKNILNPKEVSEMAAFLLSERSGSISGQIFEMDYGIVSFKV